MGFEPTTCQHLYVLRCRLYHWAISYPTYDCSITIIIIITTIISIINITIIISIITIIIIIIITIIIGFTVVPLAYFPLL